MKAQLYEYEMALLANLVPQQVEEAFALVPSLRVSDVRLVGCVVGWVRNGRLTCSAYVCSQGVTCALHCVCHHTIA